MQRSAWSSSCPWNWERCWRRKYTDSAHRGSGPIYSLRISLDRFRNGRRRSRVYSLQACLGQEGNEVVGIDIAVVVKNVQEGASCCPLSFPVKRRPPDRQAL